MILCKEWRNGLGDEETGFWSCSSCMLKCVYSVCCCTAAKLHAKGPAESHLRTALLIAGAHAFCM